MCPFDYNARNKSEMSETEAARREERLLLKAEQQFSPSKKFSLNRDVLGESSLKNSPRKRRMRNKREENCVQVVEIINLDYEKVAFQPKNRARTEIYTTTSKIITRSTNHSSDGSHLLKVSKSIATEHLATADMIAKRTEEANEMLEDTALRLEV